MPALTTTTRPQVMLPWILAHWEEYHTGELLYGDGVIGVLVSGSMGKGA